MLMHMQVMPLLPSRGISWLLQLGMAPWTGHWCLCYAWCSRRGSCWRERGAQAAFGTGILGPNRAPNRISPSRRSRISKIR